MNILITLDYEVFLGKETGTVENCLIKPIQKLTAVAEKYNIKFILFVDATYILRLKQLMNCHARLKDDYAKIRHHLKLLTSKGHDIQLHIHPHWMYSDYNGKTWIVDKTHYKLSDLPQKEAMQIFVDSKFILEDIIGYPVTAYRAGGFSAQPFSLLKELFTQHHIKIDSSVFAKSRYYSLFQQYDYREIPNKTYYTFEDDLCIENPKGSFIELPLTTMKISPFFYWRLALTRVRKRPIHTRWGDGKTTETSKESLVKRLTKYTWAYATIDEFKSSYLNMMFQRFLKKFSNDDYFVIIGHPKLVTPYSVQKFGEFCAKYGRNNNFVTTKTICPHSSKREMYEFSD